MPRSFAAKILTAHDLIRGDTVYLAPDGEWTRHRDGAELIEDAGLAELRLLDAEARAHEVTGPRLTEARRPAPA